MSPRITRVLCESGLSSRNSRCASRHRSFLGGMNLTPVPQPVNVPLTCAVLFWSQSSIPAPIRARVRFLCGDLASLVRAVGFRAAEPGLSCVMGIGSDAWDRLFGRPRPGQLHPFREIKAPGRHAVATPGDLLFHIRAQHFDLCFELGAQIVARLGSAISVVDEVHGFRYFDARDLLGFVDGTENPTGQAAKDATLIGQEDAAFAGGSYVIAQKYLHDLASWNALSTEEQERVIGRAKLSDIETDDAMKAPYAHNVLTTIEKDGKELKIVRDNMPFGRAGGEFGTYFIGYCQCREPSSRCSKTCSSESPRVTTTVCSISAARLPATCSSCRPPRSWTT